MAPEPIDKRFQTIQQLAEHQDQAQSEKKEDGRKNDGETEMTERRTAGAILRDRPFNLRKILKRRNERTEEMKRGNGETRGRRDDGKAGAIQCDRPFDLRKDIETGKRRNGETRNRETEKRGNGETGKREDEETMEN